MRPRHDPPPRKPSFARASAAFVRSITKRGPRRPRDGDAGGDPCPVEPNRPLDLSGGAVAALEFDD